ncbi:MAG: hypothetical protein PVS3B1_00260 [Ktedonobacteraceae bacterium]
MKTFDLDRYVGQTLNDCCLEQLLSHGDLSAVYRARQLTTERSVALTVFLLPETTPETVRVQFCSQFLAEVPALTKLHHPNLFPIYGCGALADSPYLITPYATEGSLATLIKQRDSWSPTSILPLLAEVTQGLEYAHRNGQVHGMLTAANLLPRSNGSYQVAAVGLRHLLQRCAILPYTQGIEHIFTPQGASKYLAPEYQQEHILTIRSDIYALGVILLELFAGDLLPNDVSTQQILWQLERCIPSPWQPVLHQALAADPTQRFQRMNDLFIAFAALIPPEEMQEQTSPSQPALALTSADMLPDQQTDSHVDFEQERLPSSAEANVARSTSVVFSIPKLNASKQPKRQKVSASRRQVTATLAGAAVLGITGIAGFNLVQMLTARMQPQTTVPAANSIGQTGQAINSAVTFNDMRLPEHRQRLLIHLPNGSFVAYKQGCTHAGVLVNYDPQTHLLVCPAHGAIFDPAQHGKVIMGPATTPLPTVAIQIRSTGAIILV